MEGNINSMAVTSIDYRLLDSLYAPSTLHDPSAHRSIPILAARRLDPSNLVELDAVFGSIHSITPPAALLMPAWLPREVSVILLSGPLSSVLVIVGQKGGFFFLSALLAITPYHTNKTRLAEAPFGPVGDDNGPGSEPPPHDRLRYV